MSVDYEGKIKAAVMAVRNKEKDRKKNYPDHKALSEIVRHLEDKFVARSGGLGLSEGQVNVPAHPSDELRKTYEWIKKQYLLLLLTDLRRPKAKFLDHKSC